MAPTERADDIAASKCKPQLILQGDVAPPKTRRKFEIVYATLLCGVNLLILATAWQDRSWGALALAFMIGPLLNGAFLVLGLVAIPLLKQSRTEFSLGRHLALTVGGPATAAVVDFIAIMSWDLYGC